MQEASRVLRELRESWELQATLVCQALLVSEETKVPEAYQEDKVPLVPTDCQARQVLLEPLASQELQVLLGLMEWMEALDLLVPQDLGDNVVWTAAQDPVGPREFKGQQDKQVPQALLEFLALTDSQEPLDCLEHPVPTVPTEQQGSREIKEATADLAFQELKDLLEILVLQVSFLVLNVCSFFPSPPKFVLASININSKLAILI